MDQTNTMRNSYKNTMALRQPRRKRRVRLRPHKPFPINIGSNSEWTVYTGYLSNLGVCITNPYEIEALHSMGFFGKGSLSRSYPNFEKTRNGIPPVVRQRQWARRQVWLEQAKNLDSEGFVDDSNDEGWENVGQLDFTEQIDQDKHTSDKKDKSPSGVTEVNDTKTNENASELDAEVARDVEAENSDESAIPPKKRLKLDAEESHKSSEEIESNENRDSYTSGKSQSGEDVLISEVEEEKSNPNRTENVVMKPQESHKTDKQSQNVRVDEVVLGSSEEEDEICEILNNETGETTSMDLSSDKDIVLLNEVEMSANLDDNYYETENKDSNTADDIELLEREILVLPDSDSEVEDYLSQVKPTIETEGFPIRETMYLTFEETFFLMFGLGCLQIVDFDGNLLNILDAWNYFCRTQNDFVQRYVVYHYFRSKGWVVKPGLKYGGDFLLYKQGPPFYHASYIVIIEVLDANTFIRDENKTSRKMTWQKLFGLDRLSETAAKEILFAQVLWPLKIPRDEILPTPELLAEFTVKELLYRRWIPKEKREEIDVEDDNDELN